MSIEASIVDLLRADTGVSALVAQRIYPSLAPQKAAGPYIVYEVLAVEPSHAHDGRTAGDRYLFQLSAVADSLSIAKAVGEAIDAALDTASSAAIQIILKRNEYSDSVFSGGGSDSPVVRVVQDYLVISA